MTDGNRTFLKWSVLTCFLTKKQFYYRKIFVISCHLNCILWMKDNARQVVSTFLNAVFKPLLKIGIYTFQHLTINCCHFLPIASFRSDKVRGFWVQTCDLRYPHKKKKSQVVKSGDLGGHGMSPKREMTLPGNIRRTTSIDNRAVCGLAPSC